MSHLRKGSVTASQIFGQTKILFASAPGKTGLLVEGKKNLPMKIKDGHEALSWCETNHACLFYMPAETGSGN